jgi:hypothetical protein
MIHCYLNTQLLTIFAHVETFTFRGNYFSPHELPKNMIHCYLNTQFLTIFAHVETFTFRGNYFSPPWTTKKCAMPPWTTNSTKIEHSTTKDNHFPPFRQSHAVLPSFFFPLFPLWTTTIFLFSTYELPSSSNMPPYKTAHDPLIVCFNSFDWRKMGKMVVFGSWMLYFGRVGSSWGHCAFFGSSWEKKVITLYFYLLLFYFIFFKKNPKAN